MCWQLIPWTIFADIKLNISIHSHDEDEVSPKTLEYTTNSLSGDHDCVS